MSKSFANISARMSAKLDPRLSLCAEFITKGGVLLDVGTDHASLPCFLIESGAARLAYASDIAEGPLCAARKNIKKRGLEDKVFPILSDGLKDIPAEILAHTTDIVIAGMGGELIAEILSFAKGLKSGVNFVLQPNTRARALREFLAESGYKTVAERAARDGKFIYTVINARGGGEPKKLDRLAAEVGALDPADAPSREYLLNEIKRLRAAARGIASSESEAERKRAAEIYKTADEIEEYISRKG